MSASFVGAGAIRKLLVLAVFAALLCLAITTSSRSLAKQAHNSPSLLMLVGGQRALITPEVFCSTLQFSTPVTYTANTRPRSSTTGYFNSDTNLDLVVTDYSANSISVFLGQANGTFSPALNYSVGVHPVSVAVADFNADYKADLVVANYDSANVSILLGNGDGTFQSALNSSSNIGPYGVTVGDFNEDTYLDVATSNVNFGTINVMFGNGDGTLQPPTQYSAGLRPQVIAAGYFNADEHIDLVVPNYTASTVSVFLGNGDGTFQAAVTYPVTAGPDYLTLADLNADGYTDLVLSHYATTNNIGVALGNGDGTFQAETTYSTGGSNPTFASVGDYNGDNILDLASPGYQSDNVSILIGNGGGTFQPAVSFALSAGSSPVSVLPGDFNSDGRLDLFTANENTNDISVLLSTCISGTPSPTTVVTLTATRTGTVTGTAIGTATRTVTSAPTQTPVAASATLTVLPSQTTTVVPPTSTSTGVPSTNTPLPVTSTATATMTVGEATGTPVATATACAITYTDVPPDSTFYPFIRCLSCRGIVSGYVCGGAGEPCDPGGNSYFRPNINVTRGQIAKIVSNAAGFQEDPDPQIYEDVTASNTFYQWINRLSRRGYMGGYPCGTVPEEPCGAQELPYFRPFANATRGQLAKIVSNAAGFNDVPAGQIFADVPSDNSFYLWIERLALREIMGGYPCGGVNEPCDDQQRPYFRPYSNVTRGQTSKIVSGAFFPDCQTPAR